ncbi:MAG: MFS transporter [Planctomycetes bacterium]|nr:MFS transporter [Planctomycetota bacterium]NUQ35465.1 MFS transporter [Planctomycetaceae bacterium]
MAGISLAKFYKPHPPLSRVGRYTYGYHRAFQFLEGIFNGIALNSGLVYVMLRTMNVAEDDKALLSMLMGWLPSASVMTAPLWAVSQWRGTRYLSFVAIVGRVLPFSIFFFEGISPWAVVVITTFHAWMCSGVNSASNAVFGSNYEPAEREHYYGLVKRWHIAGIIAGNTLFMSLLDPFPELLHWIVPVSGGVGALSLYMLRRPKVRRAKTPPISARMPETWPSSLSPLQWMRRGLQPFAATARLLNRDRDFAIFELAFVIYGAAFMMLAPVIPVFYDKVFAIDLHLFSFHNVVAYYGMQFLGHILLANRLSQWKETSIMLAAYLTVALYPALLLVAWLTAPVSLNLGLGFALAGFVIFGIGMTFLDYAWALGPVRFARGRDALPYTSTHVMFVGVRASFAYPLSLLLMSIDRESFLLPFVVPFTWFLIASGIAIWLKRRMVSRMI